MLLGSCFKFQEEGKKFVLKEDEELAAQFLAAVLTLRDLCPSEVLQEPHLVADWAEQEAIGLERLTVQKLAAKLYVRKCRQENTSSSDPCLEGKRIAA